MSAAAVLVLVAAAIWLGTAVWLSVIDLRTRTLPTKIIWPCAGAVWALYSIAALIDGEPAGLGGAVLGALAASAPLLLVHFVHPPSMGFGDVRFSVLNGLLCGWWGWPIALLGLGAAFLLALPEALFVMARHGARASRPLGPYLAAGTAAAVAWAIYLAGVVPLR